MRKASSLAVLPCCGLLAPKLSARSMVLKHLPPAGTFCCECRLHVGLDPAGARKHGEFWVGNFTTSGASTEGSNDISILSFPVLRIIVANDLFRICAIAV